MNVFVGHNLYVPSYRWMLVGVQYGWRKRCAWRARSVVGGISAGQRLDSVRAARVSTHHRTWEACASSRRSATASASRAYGRLRA